MNRWYSRRPAVLRPPLWCGASWRISCPTSAWNLLILPTSWPCRISLPNVTGKTEVEAASALEKAGLDYRVVGDGDTVTDQVPSYGAKIPGTAQVVLYMGGTKPEEPVTVPDVTGLSVAAARSQLEQAGLYMKGTGAADSTGNVVASKQNVTGQAPVGTVVTVEFVDLDQRAQ